MGTENAQACVPSQTEPQVKLTVVLVPPCSVDTRSGRHSHTLHAGSACVGSRRRGHVGRRYAWRRAPCGHRVPIRHGRPPTRSRRSGERTATEPARIPEGRQMTWSARLHPGFRPGLWRPDQRWRRGSSRQRRPSNAGHGARSGRGTRLAAIRPSLPCLQTQSLTSSSPAQRR